MTQTKIPVTKLISYAEAQLPDKVPTKSQYAKEIVAFLVKNRSKIYTATLPQDRYDDIKNEVNKIIDKIKSGTPLEHITKECSFLDTQLLISDKTLIPRVETEQLVDIVHKHIKLWVEKTNFTKELVIIDLGTGSGNIIVALGKLLKTNKIAARLIGTDISSKAIEIASQNAKRNSVDVNFYKSNFIKDIPPELIKKIKSQPTFIVSNPPYITPRLYKQLPPEVKDREPRRALVGGKRGIKYYKRIRNQIRLLKIDPKGIFLEIDPSIAKKVVKIFKTGTVVKDCFGRKRFFVKTRKIKSL